MNPDQKENRQKIISRVKVESDGKAYVNVPLHWGGKEVIVILVEGDEYEEESGEDWIFQIYYLFVNKKALYDIPIKIKL